MERVCVMRICGNNIVECLNFLFNRFLIDSNYSNLIWSLSLWSNDYHIKGLTVPQGLFLDI